jgi:hypothetical protein
LRQIHAAVQGRFLNDHIAAKKAPPVAKLLNSPEYAAAYTLAKHQSIPEKGERPLRDPQVLWRHAACSLQPA